jgi:hypothetical protein
MNREYAAAASSAFFWRSPVDGDGKVVEDDSGGEASDGSAAPISEAAGNDRRVNGDSTALKTIRGASSSSSAESPDGSVRATTDRLGVCEGEQTVGLSLATAGPWTERAGGANGSVPLVNASQPPPTSPPTDARDTNGFIPVATSASSKVGSGAWAASALVLPNWLSESGHA